MLKEIRIKTLKLEEPSVADKKLMVKKKLQLLTKGWEQMSRDTFRKVVVLRK